MYLRKNYKDFIIIISFSVLICAVIFLFTSLMVVRDVSFYKGTAEKNKVYDGFWDRTYADDAYYNAANYLIGRQQILNIYSKEEINHLADVKNLIDKIRIVFYVLGIFLIFGLAYLHYQNYRYLWAVFAGGFAAIVLVSFFFYIFSFFDFSSLFDFFHRIFFTKESWIFNQEDLLIKLFPLGFFYDAFKRIILYSFLFGFVSFIFGLYIYRKNAVKN